MIHTWTVLRLALVRFRGGSVSAQAVAVVGGGAHVVDALSALVQDATATAYGTTTLGPCVPILKA